MGNYNDKKTSGNSGKTIEKKQVPLTESHKKLPTSPSPFYKNVDKKK